MTSNSIKFNPATGDYELSGGKPVTDTTLLTPSYIRLKANRQRWLYAPDTDWGSDYYLLRKQLTTQPATREIRTGEKALEPLINQDRASETIIEVVERQRGATLLKIQVKDSQGESEDPVLIPIGV